MYQVLRADSRKELEEVVAAAGGAKNCIGGPLYTTTKHFPRLAWYQAVDAPAPAKPKAKAKPKGK